MNKDTSIKIRKNTKIGALDAETDADFLQECFINNGDIDQLLSCNSPEAIVLGRTGAGKSALLLRIEATEPHCKKLDPNEISFKYIENSKIIKVLEELNVNLDLFYRLLWRHILAVELLKLRYDLDNEQKQSKMLQTFEAIFSRNQAKRKAIEYLRTWGDKFWEKTEVRIREITKKLEGEVAAKFKAIFGGSDIDLGAVKKLSDSERVELTEKASDIVNQIQTKELSDVIKLLAEDIFDDEKRKHYILIDQLDENWANTETRCRLIRALIEEIKTFRKIKPAKIIIALRVDLLQQVFEKTRDNGFQEEKYESYMLPLKWARNDLLSLIDIRINKVFERQYTKQDIHFSDIFPTAKWETEANAYILDRTASRPRDVMQFVNECLLQAIDSPRISWRSLKAGEAIYSKKRLNSLFEEWEGIYPSLKESVNCLRGHQSNFGRTNLTTESNKFSETICKVYESKFQDELGKIIASYFDKKEATDGEVTSALIQCFYRVGLIGLKLNATDTYLWSYIDQPLVSRSEAKKAQSIRIHKMYWRALDISDERAFDI
ncbi:MAG: P-loop ATPase, Sll1717 family [Moraxellaceae bacterium]